MGHGTAESYHAGCRCLRCTLARNQERRMENEPLHTLLSDRRLNRHIEWWCDRDERRLTPREVEVLGCMADGLTGPQIADRLFISEATVRTHRKYIFRKLGATTGPQAVATAMRLGVFDRKAAA